MKNERGPRQGAPNNKTQGQSTTNVRHADLEPEHPDDRKVCAALRQHGQLAANGIAARTGLGTAQTIEALNRLDRDGFARCYHLEAPDGSGGGSRFYEAISELDAGFRHGALPRHRRPNLTGQIVFLLSHAGERGRDVDGMAVVLAATTDEIENALRSLGPLVVTAWPDRGAHRLCTIEEWLKA